MASLTATDITVTVAERWIEGKKRYSRGTMLIAGTNTYTTGGLVLPDKTKFGMYRALNEVRITGSGGTGATASTYGSSTDYSFKYNAPGNLLQMYYGAAATSTAFAELINTAAPGPKTVDYVAIGW